MYVLYLSYETVRTRGVSIFMQLYMKEMKYLRISRNTITAKLCGVILISVPSSWGNVITDLAWNVIPDPFFRDVTWSARLKPATRPKLSLMSDSSVSQTTMEMWTEFSILSLLLVYVSIHIFGVITLIVCASLINIFVFLWDMSRGSRFS